MVLPKATWTGRAETKMWRQKLSAYNMDPKDSQRRLGKETFYFPPIRFFHKEFLGEKQILRIRLPRELRRACVGDDGRVRGERLSDECALFEFVDGVGAGGGAG